LKLVLLFQYRPQKQEFELFFMLFLQVLTMVK
jgi:hypothetical protein